MNKPEYLVVLKVKSDIEGVNESNIVQVVAGTDEDDVEIISVEETK